jgi:hypothetical protein
LGKRNITSLVLDLADNSLWLIGLLEVLDLFFSELYIYRSFEWGTVVNIILLRMVQTHTNDLFEILEAGCADNWGSYA